MLRLVRVGRCCFARTGKNSSPNYSYQQIAESKKERVEYYEKKYDFYQLFQHQDKYFQEYVYGHTVYIAGLTSNNYQSQLYTKSMMKFVQPNLLMLGGISDNYFRLYENNLKIRQFYEHPLYRAERMGCKERVNRLIQERLQKDGNFYWDDFQKQIKIINIDDKRVQPNDYLTAAHLAAGQQKTKVALGKPSDTIVFEDLIMRHSVQQLKDIASQSINKIMQTRPKQKTWRLSITRQLVQNYVMTDFPQLFTKQVTYQTALLKRYAKLEDKILMLVPGHFASRIASQVHQIDIKPQSVYRVGLQDRNSEAYGLMDRTMRTDPQQILQKFCLLTLLKQSWLQFEFANGTNIFRYFSFAKVFQNMDMDQLVARYMKAKRSVEGKWYQLMHQRAKNVHLQQGSHYRMTLSNQFKVLEERVTKNFPYTYEQKNYLSMNEDAQKLMKLQNRMREMLNEEGDKLKIELFQQFKNGHRSKQGIILYAKLLGKANIESYDRLKLPVFHYGAFRGIYKQYLRDFMLKAEENSKFQEKLKKKEKAIEQMVDKFMKKLDDPDQLHKAITGKLGKVINLSFDPQSGPVVTEDQLEQMKDFYGKMTPEKQNEIKEMFGQDWFKIIKDQEKK